MTTTDEQEEAFVNSLLQPEAETEVEVEEEDVSEEPEDPPEETDAEEAEADENEVSEDDEEDADEAGDEEQQTITVKVDGKDVTVTLDDLKRSYSGQAYIQKGMQEAAAKRKEAEQLFESLQSEQQRFIQTVQNFQQNGLMDKPKAPDLALLDKDPIAYTKAKATYDQKMEQYAAQQHHIAQMQQRSARMQQVQTEQYLREQSEILRERIPEFGDAQKASEVTTKLRKIGQEYGYSEDELNAVTDARAVQVLHDAMRWRELQSGTAKAKAKPKPPKNVKPAARRVETKSDVRNKLRQKIRKSDDPDAFADFLLSGD